MVPQREARPRQSIGGRFKMIGDAVDKMKISTFDVRADKSRSDRALALTSVVTDPTRIASKEAVEVTCEAPDDAYLLLDWLNALIYEMAVRRVVFGRFAVSIQGNRLDGWAWGEPVDRKRHRPAVEPKGATLTALKVGIRDDGAWVAQCVVDV